MQAGDLRKYLRTDEVRTDLQRRLRLSLDVLEAGIVLQQCSIVHGDLRTDNVLVSRTGRAVFGDFGVARLAQAVGASTTSAPTTTPGATARVAPAKKRRYWLAPENLTKTEGKTLVVTCVCLWSCLFFLIMTIM